MSWLNYVLLGKVYEMKGMNRKQLMHISPPLIYAQGQTPFLD